MKQLFERMCALVETKGFDGLQSYRSDLYVEDHAQLQNTWTPQTRYLWIVRQNGTHLFELHMHPMIHAAADACMRSIANGNDASFYLLQDTAVTRITRDVAATLLSRVDWRIRSGRFTDRNGRELAQYDVSHIEAGNWRKLVSVDFTGPLGWSDLSAYEQTALYLNAIHQSNETGSLLSSNVQRITYNGDVVFTAGERFITTLPHEVEAEA